MTARAYQNCGLVLRHSVALVLAITCATLVPVIGCDTRTPTIQQEQPRPTLVYQSGETSSEAALSTVTRNLAQLLSSGSAKNTFRAQINAVGNERKAVGFRQLWSFFLADPSTNWAEVVDTAAVGRALRELPQTLEVYPYWRQRGIWEEGQLPDQILVVYWDSRQGERDAVEGFVTGSLEPITLRDGDAHHSLVVVVAVPEETDQALGYGRTATALPKTSSPQGDQGWIWQVHYVHVYNDHEPDWAEPPEFYVKAKANNGDWQSTSITPPVNNTSPWYFTKTIYDFGNSRASYSQLEIWEDDGWGTGADDLVESYWYYSGEPGSCSKWVDTYSTYERQCIGCYGDRGADVTVQVREN